MRVVDSRPSVLLHLSGGYNCLTKCWLQMFVKPQVWVEYGNRTSEHQSGHHSSYWLKTSMLNFRELTRTGVTHSPPHPTKDLRSMLWDLQGPCTRCHWYFLHSPRMVPHFENCSLWRQPAHSVTNRLVSLCHPGQLNTVLLTCCVVCCTPQFMSM